MTFEQLRAALARVSARDLGLLEPSQPLAHLGLDSISLADLALVLQDEFGVELKLEELAELETLQDLVDRINA